MQARTCGWERALNGKKVARKKNGVLSVAHSPYLTSILGPDLDPGSLEGCGIGTPTMCHLVINLDMLGKRRSWLTEHRETVPYELFIRQTQVHVVVV